MQKILSRRAVRNFCKNWPRYLALMGLILFSFFIVICMTSSAETIITGTRQLAEQDKVEDGEFSTFVPLTDREEQQLREEGILLEKMFSTDYQVLEKTTLRVFKVRQNINLLRPVTGRLPEKVNEIALERRYSEKNDLLPGDTLTLAGKTMTVSGIVTTADYEGPFQTLGDSTIDSRTFGTGFVRDEAYEGLKRTGKGLQAEDCLYAYRLEGAMTHEELKEKLQGFPFDADAVSDPYFREYWDRSFGRRDEITQGMEDFSQGLGELCDGMQALTDAAENIPFGLLGAEEFPRGLTSAKEGADDLKEGFSDFRGDADALLGQVFDESQISNLKTILKADENPRIGSAANDAKINQASAPVAGVIVIVLVAYVASVFVTHEIERDTQVIGTLYALGVTRRDLLLHYLCLPVVTTFLAGTVSFFLGSTEWAINLLNADSSLYFSVPDLEPQVPRWLMIYAMVVPALVAALVNLLVISRKLQQPALSMLRGESKQKSVSKLKLKHLSFVSRFRIRQLLREFRGATALVLGIFISYLLLTLGINCYVLCSTIDSRTQQDISFQRLYTYKYPDAQVPEGGWEACGRTMKMENMGYKMDVTLLGIQEDNPYFHLELADNQSEVTISDSTATKFHLSKGDTFTLEDPENQRFYAFRVGDMIPYSPGFMVFMDIREARELLGGEEDYFNMVLSDHDLDIPSGKLYNTLRREDMISASHIFMEFMMPFITILLGGSLLVFVIVMFLMMRVMVDRSAKSIALFRIFGYRTREIRKLYLDGNFLVAAVGAAFALPLAKKIMDGIYPYFISNVACAVYLSYPWYFYILIWAATMAVYLLISVVLMAHIRRITPADSLANRE